jgi:predicted aspartyl protease
VRTPFKLDAGYIGIYARFRGPGGEVDGHLALDTGAARTLVHPDLLARIGYGVSLSDQSITLITGSGTHRVAIVPIASVEALGASRTDLQVICHALPASAGVDGVLGLDFMRDQCLSIDFRNGWITLD